MVERTPMQVILYAHCRISSKDSATRIKFLGSHLLCHSKNLRCNHFAVFGKSQENIVHLWFNFANIGVYFHHLQARPVISVLDGLAAWKSGPCYWGCIVITDICAHRPKEWLVHLGASAHCRLRFVQWWNHGRVKACWAVAKSYLKVHGNVSLWRCLTSPILGRIIT